MDAKKEQKKNVKGRVIALLNREEMEYLEKLGMDSLFSTGTRLTKIDIVSALVRAAMIACVNAEGIKDKKELALAIIKAAGEMASRRAYPRVNKNLIVRFRKVEDLGKFARTASKDISFTGLQITLGINDRHPRFHDPIELELTDPKAPMAPPVKAIGRVVWIKENPDGKTISAGIKISYVKGDDAQRFEEFLGGNG